MKLVCALTALMLALPVPAAALVPPPRAHLTRFHDVCAPNANLRSADGLGRGRHARRWRHPTA